MDWKRTFLLFLLALLPFLPTLRAGFLNWDDDLYLTENPDVTSPDGWSHVLSRFASDANVYPTVFASFRWEHFLWGFHPMGYHAVNVLLHGLVTVLLFFLLVRLGVAERMAWWSGLLFAVHPMQVATVAWVSERKSLLGVAFLLAAWLAYLYPALDSRFRGNDGKLFPRLVAWSSLPLAALSYLSKSSLVVFPVLLLVTDLSMGKRSRRPLLWWFHLGVSVALAWVYSAREVGNELGFLERLSVVPKAFFHYLATWAFPLHLGGIYPLWKSGPIGAGGVGLALGLLALLLAVVAFRESIGRVEWLGLLFFVVPIAPSLGLIAFGYQKHSMVSDHFAYLAISGLSLLLVSVLGRATRKSIMPFTVACTCLALAWGALSWRQCGFWKSSEVFWRRTLVLNPESWAAHQNYATWLDSQGKTEEALHHYERSVEIDPEEPIGWINLGRALIRAGLLDGAEESLERALRLNPYYAETYSFLAEVHGRKGEARKVLETLQEGYEKRPDSEEIRLRLASLYLNAASEEVRDASRAAALLEPLANRPNGPFWLEAMGVLVDALGRQGKTEEALAIEEKRLKLLPEGEGRIESQRRVSFLQRGLAPPAASK